ncbi:flagellar protein export ATPase FliI [Helicobacter kayseriensis]|uniref:flagellar protein export ATPase FliI n=1 Tax=Helicobacter kayseriensis TaxID=2905877 RepID=UPI001E4A287D|nr:flagellar protein export ATPase FliI [Helicobacter kayseriensis]MCE3047740.1 flagellar protein export ATPase FliI [Helicobacter kayseriensis]MCE3049109.1 flagellar protein export ATPase FliI [Helicobacter kayseriensis]
MPLNSIKQKLSHSSFSLSPSFGILSYVFPTNFRATGLKPNVGDIVEVHGNNKTIGIVTASRQDSFDITPFSFVEGHKSGDRVYLLKTGLTIPVGDFLLGRIINPLGEPLDEKGEIPHSPSSPIIKPPISALKRGMIDEAFHTGIKSIDGLLTVGKGQKLGIFAGSGVGKSTLMGMIVRGSSSPIKVIALIGERGREVPDFIHKNLNGDLSNTVLVVATSDDSPLMRKYGAFSAMAIAEYFQNQGHDVLLLMDSITRFAMAQREIGLSLGEPPTSKGYPPSALTLLPQLIERAGKLEGKGAITAFFTVLVEGDDLSDPIADQSRSILDGHIVLSREMTDFGIYPPINPIKSASRVSSDITDEMQKKASQKFRKLYSLLKENEVLIRIGAYQYGNDPLLDEAIDKKDWLELFLKQEENEVIDFKETQKKLQEIL